MGSSSSFRVNLTANYAGAVITAIVQLFVVPVYLKLMGVEGYGLVGISITLGALAVLLDFGVTPALTREIARLSGQAGGAPQMRSLVRTLETYYVLAIVLFVLILSITLPELHDLWQETSMLTESTIRNSLGLMSIMAGGQLLIGFFGAGLLGMQKHVSLNIINVSGILLKNVGAIPILIITEGSVEAFFDWYLAVTILHAIVLRMTLWRRLPEGEVRLKRLRELQVWRYASGMAGVVALSLLLSQLDKVIVAHFVTLEQFGLFSAAAAFATILSKPSAPIFNTLVPRLTQLIAEGASSQVVATYNRSVQISCALVLPLALTLIVFGEPIVGFLMGKSLGDTVSDFSLIVSILAVGYACNALVYLSYGLTLAHGWVRFAINQNLLACSLMIPMTIWLVLHYGVVGGAVAWAILNVGFLLISPYFIHCNLMPSNLDGWLRKNIIPGLLASLIISLLLRGVMGVFNTAGSVLLIIIVLNLILSFLVTVLVLPDTRRIAVFLCKRALC
jgi:O-antigen/teichoic acid export membrane protein